MWDFHRVIDVLSCNSVVTFRLNPGEKQILLQLIALGELSEVSKGRLL